MHFHCKKHLQEEVLPANVISTHAPHRVAQLFLHNARHVRRALQILEDVVNCPTHRADSVARVHQLL